MKDEIRRLRSEAHHLARGKAPSGHPVPGRVRAAAVAITRTQLSQGMAVSRVAATLGLPTQSLVRWLVAPTRPVLRPVAIASAPEATAASRVGPVLITPRGVRVEGLERTLPRPGVQALKSW